MPAEYLNNKNFEKLIIGFQQTKADKKKIELILADIQDTKKRKQIRKNDTKKETALLLLYQEKYKEVSHQHIAIQEDLTRAFYTLSENIVRYAKFNNIEPDDAVQDGVLTCFDKIDKFNPSRGKAFNYMTTCILNHFKQIYRTIRNYVEFKKKYMKHLQNQGDKIMIIRNGREVANN